MIAVIDYGAGNLRSIVNGLRRVGAETRIVDDPMGLHDADAIVLPGVGSFGDAMARLAGFKYAIVDAVDSGRPFLGLCLGIQVLLEGSEESPGVAGLGILEGECKRFRGKLKVPHMGWNTIEKDREVPLLEGIADGDYFYFVHSYYPVPKDKDVVVAKTEYGIKFPSVVGRGSVYATQFHPEKSGEKGLKILANFVKLSRK